MRYASEKHENVKDRMKVLDFFTECVKGDAAAIKASATEQEPESDGAQCLIDPRDAEDDGPADGNVADHTKGLIPRKINGIQRNGERGQAPNDGKGNIGGNGTGAHQGTEQKGCIRSRNQKIDGTVVDDLKDTLGRIFVQAVIDA